MTYQSYCRRQRARHEYIFRTVTRDRLFPGTIVIPSDEDARLADNLRLESLVERRRVGRESSKGVPVHQWMAYWSDGSLTRERAGAGVVWGSEIGPVGDVKVEGQRAYRLGINTSSSGDAELYGIAAALGLALEEYFERGRLNTIRVYTDARSILQALQNSRTTVPLGPILDDDEPLAVQLLFDRTEQLLSLGVRVELIWVKGHCASRMNGLADIQATNMSHSYPVPQIGFVNWPEIPRAIEAKGSKVVEEWEKRGNKVISDELGSDAMDISDEDTETSTTTSGESMDISDED
ncbi:hypothetical protein N0V90_011700 [Kalmusia sp. IMI 367209]|nr:hypothetical protein N0V90_011700 [Kalmusia sp. IMI 367209]